MRDRPDWTVLDAALDAALDLDGPDRAAYLSGLDAGLRGALAPLLRDALADDPLLDAPLRARAALTEPDGGPAAVTEGARVGPYRIEGLVGEGGMGRVYRARRADGAFDQTVALKVVRQSLALAGSDVAARLRRERALLAALDHPGIARLVDGGETPDGVPYLVTEFVDGQPLTAYADGARLGVQERVRLLADVAKAVDHAHRRLVVHRDLKPSNVLVTERDGGARPVVLDFGIAKLLDAAEEGSGAFPLTRTGMRLLTPAYAAPELYDPTTDVTTAADVYGLGALLYELLTGQRPHDGDATSASGPRHGPPTSEPTRPSRVVTSASEGEPPPFDVGRRSRALRGDLDVICLRALHPEPDRRYRSAAALAADLERYLAGEAVEARRDSWAYVAGRYVRRHRATVAAAGLALVAGLSLAVVAFGRERAARAEAEAAAARATETADLLTALISNADPFQTGGRKVSVREALDGGIDRFRDVESVRLRAHLLGVLGTTYAGIGDIVRSDSLHAEALAILGDADSGREATDLRIRRAYTRFNLNDDDGAWALVRRGLRDARRLGARDLELDATMRMVVTGLFEDRTSEEEIRGLADRAGEIAEASGAPTDRVRALVIEGEVRAAVGEVDDADRAFRAAARVAERELEPVDPTYHDAQRYLALFLFQTRQYRDAERAYHRLATLVTRVQGDGALRVGYALGMAATSALLLGEPARADAAADSAGAIGRRHLPAGNVILADWLNISAAARNALGDHDGAAVAAERALAIAEATRTTVTEPRARAELGIARLGQGRAADARRLLQRAVAEMEQPDLVETWYDGELDAARDALARAGG